MWDPEGNEDRLMVYIMYQDVYLRRGQTQAALAKKNSLYVRTFWISSS